MRAPRTALLLLVSSAPAIAQCEIARLDSNEPLSGLGAIALAGDVVALSGAQHKVVIFERGATGWAQSGTLDVPGVLTLFSSLSLACDVETLVAGMPQDGGDVAPLSGSVHVYERGGGWSHSAKLTPSAAQNYDLFGSDLSLEGQLLAIGAVSVFGPGRSFVFERIGTGWVEAAEFHPHDVGVPYGGYAQAVDTDGRTVVVGSYNDSELVGGGGAVYVYELGAGGWFEAAKLAAQVPVEDAAFGLALAVEGTSLLVGAPTEGNGRVHVFERGPAGWAPVQVLEDPAGRVGDRFGDSLDLAFGRAVIGSPRAAAPNGTLYVGRVTVFERQAGAWHRTTSLVAEDVSSPGFFGAQVALDGNRLLWSGPNPLAQVRLHSLGLERSADFCESAPNSSGEAATISIEGCDSVLASDLDLRLAGAPPGELGLFLFAAHPGHTPFGSGFLCLSAPFLRLSGGVIDVTGHLSLALDFSSAPANQMTPGDTWYFQAFFRDPGFGAGFGTSDGVAVLLAL